VWPELCICRTSTVAIIPAETSDVLSFDYGPLLLAIECPGEDAAMYCPGVVPASTHQAQACEQSHCEIPAKPSCCALISGGFRGCEDLSGHHGVLCQLLKCFLGIYSFVPNWLAAVSIMSRKPFEAVSRSLYALTGLAWRVGERQREHAWEGVCLFPG